MVVPRVKTPRPLSSLSITVQRQVCGSHAIQFGTAITTVSTVSYISALRVGSGGDSQAPLDESGLGLAAGGQFCPLLGISVLHVCVRPPKKQRHHSAFYCMNSAIINTNPASSRASSSARPSGNMLARAPCPNYLDG